MKKAKQQQRLAGKGMGSRGNFGGKAGIPKWAGAAGTWPPPGQCNAFLRHGTEAQLSSEAMLGWAASNTTLVNYLYQSTEPAKLADGWKALTAGCRIAPRGCWCFHVEGSMLKSANPNGHKRCAPKDKLLDCSSDPSVSPAMVRKDCSCFVQQPVASPCLFGDMRPAKLLAIIAACRAAGVTHIIEQGRYGGLSAAIYALAGFRVTSIELLPLTEVTAAMGSFVPSVRLIDGDGRAEVVKLVRALPPNERVAVIFDGEKRLSAYTTFRLVKKDIALAVFDDSNLDDGAFPRKLQEEKEAAWHTWDCAFMRRHNDSVPLARLSARLRRAAEAGHPETVDSPARRVNVRVNFQGGMEDLARFHSTIVAGGRWPGQWSSTGGATPIGLPEAF